MKTPSPAVIISAVAALACFVGVFSLPYSYYMLLRCIATGSAVYLLACHVKALPDAGKWSLVVIALLFNPIFKAHLGREVWQVVDPAAGSIFFWVALVIKRSSNKSPL
ncbi:MAG: hypothetical protein JNM99_25160 [Verrucomicrobiaceae bacterium]|nr:hypothetical protein [Verrucomicrobiaceae bacterium]